MSAFVRAAVLGHPVAHSKSPLIHNHWIEQYGLSGSYEAIDIAPENLERAVRDLVERGYAGFNVTVPHKSTILSLCAQKSETAERIGAANTISVRNDGTLYADNNDIFGFIENIRENAPGFDFRSGPAAILGAGGAARAAVEGLFQQACPEITLCNRTTTRAEEIRKSARFPDRIHVREWSERDIALKNAALLVNTTTLGMKGQPSLEIPLYHLDRKAPVVDIVYAPLETDLLKAARARGNPVVTGIGMLLHQARPAFAAWFGVMPEISDSLLQKVLS